MKAFRLVLFLILPFWAITSIQAQVKIGDNPLDIGTERLLEIERAGELLIITDSLEFGITTNVASNLTSDALMIKLFGYGLGNFTPLITGTIQDYFLGTNNAGEVLEFPLSLDLVTSSPSTATLSLNNGTTTFGSVDLTNLDSVFATDVALNDSINILRNLIAISEASDGDTITGNEWIDEIEIEPDQRARMYIYENTGVPDPARHSAFVDLGYIFVTDVELLDTIDSIRIRVTNQIADTSTVLRELIYNSNIYTSNGTLSEDRVLTGAGNSLTFTGIDSFMLSADDIDINGTGNLTNAITGAISVTSGTTTTSTSGGDNTTTSSTGNIVLNSTAGNVDINAGAGNVEIDGTVYAEDYGAGNTGNEAWLLGVQADGRIVDVSLDSIGGDAILSSPVDLDENGTQETTVDEAIQAANAEIDSTIYNYHGTLTADRILTGASNSLIFTGLDSFDISGSNIAITGTGNLTEAITGSITSTGADATVTTTGDNTLTSSGANVVLNSTAGNVDINAGAGNIEIDGTVYAEDYGAGNTGNEAWLLGVQADGRLVDVSLDSIGGDAILSSPVDLDENGTQETTVDEAIQAANLEIDSTIYNYHGTLTADRILTGASNSLIFTGLDSFDISGSNIAITGTGNLSETITGSITSTGADATVTTTGDNTLTSSGANVVLNSTAGNVDINAGAGNVEIDGTVYAEDYGAGNTGNEAWLLGVQADGRLVDVSLDSIGGDAILSSPVDLDENGTQETTVDEAIQAANLEIDSTIYNYHGTLTADRILTGASNSLIFTGLDSFDISGSNIAITGTGNLSETITGSITSTGADATVTTTGDNTLTSSGANVVLNSTAGNVDINAGAGNVEIDGTVYAEDYGAGNTGNEAWLLGVQADGRLVDVSLDSIGGDAILSSPVDLDENGTQETTVDEAIQAANLEIDSTIYNYNGTLTDMRTMSMDGNNLFFVGTSNDTVVITNDGKIGVNTGSFTPNSPTSDVKLEVNGDILAIQVHASSDMRFKKNIKPIESALQKVMKIDGVTYDFRTDEFPGRNFPDRSQIGFIAQNIEESVPEVVMTDGDGFKAVDYSKVTALLNEAIKEQQQEIQNLKQELKIVNSRNETMAREITSIKAFLMNNHKVLNVED